ncbi:MAG: hypothetical protein H6492_02385 [Candidatus Paracaedibacteraceae bacterium]|nr:hypothetical protein [Candidatus Paracaedibacteraceae bacterium]
MLYRFTCKTFNGLMVCWIIGLSFVNGRAITSVDLKSYEISAPVSAKFLAVNIKSVDKSGGGGAPSATDREGRDLPSSVAGAAAIPAARTDIDARTSLLYASRYNRLKNDWKNIVRFEETPVEFFFESEAATAEITDVALQALMYRFLIDNPSVSIPDLDSFRVFTVADYTPGTHRAVIRDREVKNSLLEQAKSAFSAGKRLYASVVQVGGAEGGHYTVVVIENTGKVHMLNTFKPYEGTPSEEEYQYILRALVVSLNAQKGSSSIVFSEGINTRTGIQDSDIASNSCGLYSFAYWAALMATQDMDAYQRVTAAASDGRLARYGDINAAASYGRKLTHITQVFDREERLVIDGIAENIKYYKNPHADIQAGFESDLREWLQRELRTLLP